MKLLILSDIPAPYRIAVFGGLAEKYETDVYFNSASNDQRNQSWYIRSGEGFCFSVLGKPETDALFAKSCEQIQQYDAVLCYDPWNKRSRALARLCMRKKIPYVLNADGALGINASFPKKLVKSFYVKRAAKCFAGCERAAEYFRVYGSKEAQIVKHPFTSVRAAQILRRPYSREEKASMRQELGMAEGTVFITAGQFILRKGYDLLLDAWQKTEQNASLYIIGGGPLREEYEKTIREKNLKNVFVRDFMPPAELFRWYQAADVFVMPTREDIWGLVVNEAMACGLPVISSDHCTAGNELIVNGENGYVYPVEQTHQLAAHIDSLSRDEQLREKMAESAINSIRSHTLENIIDSHISAIQGIGY